MAFMGNACPWFLLSSWARFSPNSVHAFGGVHNKCMALVPQLHTHADSGVDVEDDVLYKCDVGTNRSKVDRLGKSSHRAPVGFDRQDLGQAGCRQREHTDVSSHVDEL